MTTIPAGDTLLIILVNPPSDMVISGENATKLAGETALVAREISKSGQSYHPEFT